MSPRTLATVFAALALVLGSSPAGAQTEEAPGAVVLVLDASGSMLEPDGQGGTKIDTAKAALRTLIDDLPQDQQVGLRVYGHRVPSRQKAEACQDTEAIVPVGPLDRAQLRSAVDSFQALGETPIGLSLQQAAADLPGDTSGAIVLVSDGRDECFPELGPEPCQVARDLAAQGVELQIEAVGLQVDDAARSQLQCIAEATGGTYVDVTDASRLADELTRAQARARRSFEVRGQVVEGGPSMIDATPLDDPTGTYTDSILSGEELWYSVEVLAGHDTRATVTLDASANPERTGGNLDVAWVDDTGRERGDAYRGMIGDTVDTAVAVFEDRTFEPGEPVTLNLRVTVGHFPEGLELPLVIELEGTPAVAATTTTVADSEAAGDADADAEPEVDVEQVAVAADEGDPLLTLPGVGLGLVVGAVAGAGGATLRRRRDGADQP